MGTSRQVVNNLVSGGNELVSGGNELVRDEYG